MIKEDNLPLEPFNEELLQHSDALFGYWDPSSDEDYDPTHSTKKTTQEDLKFLYDQLAQDPPHLPSIKILLHRLKPILEDPNVSAHEKCIIIELIEKYDPS